MRKMKTWTAGLALALCAVFTVSCQSGQNAEKSKEGLYKDGSYHGRSVGFDEFGGYGEIDIEVKDHRIVKVTYQAYNADGSLKDKTYGTEQNEGLYRIAQNSVDLIPEIEKALIDVQDPVDVDAVTGATQHANLLKDAAAVALKAARLDGQAVESGPMVTSPELDEDEAANAGK